MKLMERNDNPSRQDVFLCIEYFNIIVAPIVPAAVKAPCFRPCQSLFINTQASVATGMATAMTSVEVFTFFLDEDNS